MSRNVLVFGAAGGVGLEVTRQLLEQGWSVTATVLNDAEEKSLRGTIEQTVDVILLDLSNGDNVLPAVRKSVKELDAVAVCAAIGPVGPLETMPLAQLRKTFEINAIADVAIYQACLPMLRASKGRFVFVSSFSGKVALPFVGAYSGSKFALEGLGDAMRREAAPFGVNVSLVLPGGINTPMVQGQLEGATKARDALTPEIKALYGPLYDSYLNVFKSAQNAGLPPAQVAAVIVEAITATEPKSRYVVGDDSVFMCTQVAAMPEPEADKTLAGFLANLS